jgi:hypothetical protein
VEKIFTDPNIMLVVHVQNQLQAEDIVGELRNVYAGGASGSLAFTEVWPELWPELWIDEKHIERAESLLKKLNSEPEFVWVCAGCTEENASSFDYCWHCGELAPSAT